MQSLRIVLEIKSERWKGYFKKTVWMKFREVGKMNSGMGVGLEQNLQMGCEGQAGAQSQCCCRFLHTVAELARRMWLCS